MAVEKEKVIARFRTGKFKIAPISNQRLEAMATKLATRIPDDADDEVIDSHLDDLNDLLPGGFLEVYKTEQRQDNEKKKAKSPLPEPQNPNPNPEPEKKPDDEMPAWFKPYAQKLEAVEKKEQLQTKQQIAEGLLPDLPKGYRSLALASMPDNPEEHAAWAEGVKQQHTADQQAEANSNRGFGVPPMPAKSNGSKEAPKEVVEARAKRLMQKS